MKKLLFCLVMVSGSLAAHVKYTHIVNQAQEKLSIVLKQMHASYNWLDTTYATRERYYLSGISLDYIRQLKHKCQGHQASHALIEKMETIVEKLHVLDLGQKEFERIQCAAQNLIRPVVMSSKVVVA
jgi:hypothetical protein